MNFKKNVLMHLRMYIFRHNIDMRVIPKIVVLYYEDNVAVRRRELKKIKFNTWKDSKSYIFSTSDVLINLVE